MKYICIEGIIGSGKTKLANDVYEYLIAHKLPATLLKERFEDNKLLDLFYQYPDKYAFLAEYSFLIDRFHQLYQHFQDNTNNITIADFSFRKCLWFAEANLNKQEFLHYQKQYFHLEKELNVFPDLIIFIDIPVNQAHKNISKRGRLMEKNLSKDYLFKLQKIYSKHIPSIDNIPILRVEDNNTDMILEKILNYLNI